VKNTGELFKNRYRTQTVRAKSWDYAGFGSYFITICLKYRVPLFGEIINNKVILSKIGKIVQEVWLITPLLRNYVQLDEYIVMPDHFHGIITLNDKYNPEVETTVVETRGIASLHTSNNNSFGPQSNNLASIIRGF